MTSAVTSPIAPQRPDARRSAAGRYHAGRYVPGQDRVAPFDAGRRLESSPVPGPGTGDGDRGGPVDVRELRLVSRRPSPATFWRRRIVVTAGLVLAGLVLLGGFGQVDASADLADRVDGHAIIEPGQTLWDIAVMTAPDGVDARAHLAAIEDLNGIRADDVRAWNVILLPSR